VSKVPVTVHGIAGLAIAGSVGKLSDLPTADLPWYLGLKVSDQWVQTDRQGLPFRRAAGVLASVK